MLEWGGALPTRVSQFQPEPSQIRNAWSDDAIPDTFPALFIHASWTFRVGNMVYL